MGRWKIVHPAQVVTMEELSEAIHESHKLFDIGASVGQPMRAGVGWSAGTTTVSKAIQKFDESAFNHIFWWFDFHGLRFIYESHVNHGVQITPWEQFTTAMDTGKVTNCHLYSLQSQDLEGLEALYRACIQRHGARYDARQILVYYLWVKLTERTGHFLDFRQRAARYTCNELVCSTGRQAHIPEFTLSTTAWTPERCFRELVGAPSRLVYPMEGATECTSTECKG